MFPLRDDNPSFGTAVLTFVIIALNVAVWLLVQGMGAEPTLTHSVCAYGLIPGELLSHIRPGARIELGPGLACRIGNPNWLTPFTSMFMHGSWFHLIGNMWFLWVFGNNVEDALGHGRFVIFYLVCGLAAAAAQTMVNPSSALPMVGASGAIGGVMGGYAVQFPRSRVLTAVIFGFFVRTMWMPAYVMLGYWFLLQFLGALPSLSSEGGGVAFWAHIGGFVAGAALMFVMRNPARVPARESLA